MSYDNDSCIADYFFLFSPPTVMLQPFIAEPESPVFVEENSMKHLVWKIIDCNWQVRVVIENYILYPNLIPKQVPIKNITDYNATKTCEEDRIIVKFSISFNENVLDNNIEYVACKIYRTNNIAVINESRVNFTSHLEVLSSSTINTDATTIMDKMESNSNIARASTAMTTGSGYKPSLHLVTLTLGLIVSYLASFI